MAGWEVPPEEPQLRLDPAVVPPVDGYDVKHDSRTPVPDQFSLGAQGVSALPVKPGVVKEMSLGHRLTEEPDRLPPVASGRELLGDLEDVARAATRTVGPQLGEMALQHGEVGTPLILRRTQAVGPEPVVAERIGHEGGPAAAQQEPGPELVVLGAPHRLVEVSAALDQLAPEDHGDEEEVRGRSY